MVHDTGQRVGVERHRAGQHLKGDDAERVLVALRARPAAGALLRAHEGGRADHGTVGGEGHIRSPQRDSEIRHHDAPVSIDQDIRALQVPVHDAAVVGVRGGAAGPAQHVQHHRHGQRSLRVDDDVQGPPLDELHRDVQNATHLPHPIHGYDVGVVKLGHHTRFPLEPLDRPGGEPELGRQDFQGDRTAEPDLGRLEHHSHSAAPQLVLDFVFAGEHHPDAL